MVLPLDADPCTPPLRHPAPRSSPVRARGAGRVVSARRRIARPPALSGGDRARRAV